MTLSINDFSLEYSSAADNDPPSPPPEPDTTPPVFTSGPAASAVSHNSALISWETDEDSDSEVRYDVDRTNWSGYAGRIDSSNLTSNHSLTLTGLVPETTYYFRVRSTDAAGNYVTSNELSFTTREDPNPSPSPPPEPDTTPPGITSYGIINITQSRADIKWTTDEDSDSEVRYDIESSTWGNYEYYKNTSSFVKSHSITLTGLSANTTYYLRIRSTDAAGNAATTSEFSFTTEKNPDTTAPLFTVQPMATDTEYNSATIYWRTDEACDSEIRFDVSSTTWDNYANQQYAAGWVTNHSMILTGLPPDTTYYYRVCSTDAAGNVRISDELSFTTLADSDTPPPLENDKTAPSIVSSSKSNITQNGAVIQWITDEASDNEVRYGISSSSWDTYTKHQRSDALVTTHILILTGLFPDTVYYYRFAATDTSGNQVISDEYSFSTLAGTDTSPPQFIAWPTVTDQSDTTATIEWATNEASDSQVQYDIVSNDWETYSYALNDLNPVTQHVVTLTDLDPHTTYFFRVGSMDSVANGPAISDELEFNTDQLPDEEEPFTTSSPTIVLMFIPDTTDQPEALDAGIIALAGDEENDKLSVAISWETDEVSIGEVRYGRSSATWDNYPHIRVGEELTKNQMIMLTDLEQGVCYIFGPDQPMLLGMAPVLIRQRPTTPLPNKVFKPNDHPIMRPPGSLQVRKYRISTMRQLLLYGRRMNLARVWCSMD